MRLALPLGLEEKMSSQKVVVAEMLSSGATTLSISLHHTNKYDKLLKLESGENSSCN